MKVCVVLLSLTLWTSCVRNTEGLEELIGTDVQKCLNCLCHARTGCWSRFNCAKHSINYQYWIIAGSHTVGPHSKIEEAYKSCMENENCILNTLKSYTEQFGERDCNCDGAFDCKDRLAIHLFHESCYNPSYGDIYAMRFNQCAKGIGVKSMSSTEGTCKPEEF